MDKTWKQIYEDQIAGMADMSDASKIILLQNSLRACAEAVDRMEASTVNLLATVGKA